MEVERQNHVVVVGRMGDHAGAKIYLTVPTSKRMAMYDSEQAYRHEFGLAKNIALLSSVVFTGTEQECRHTFLEIEQKILERKAKDAKDTEGSQPEPTIETSTSSTT